MTENVVVIGSGPAGWTAAIYLARANLNPLVIEGAFSEENRLKGLQPLGQLAQTTEVENFPGFPFGNMDPYIDSALPDGMAPYRMEEGKKDGVTGPELMELMRQQAKNFGTRIITEDVSSIDCSQQPFKMQVTNGEEVVAHTVIIATGARANWLGLDSEERFKNAGVSACAVCDGALPRFGGQPLAVVGGGDSAMEEATYLSKFASKVFIIHRRDEFRASKIMAERVLENPKIEVKWNSTVDEILGDDENGVTGLRIRSTVDDSQTEEFPIVGYFAAIGHTPNTDFLGDQLTTTDKGYVVWPVPWRTNTSVEGIYAAGDVADDNYRQAVTAAGTGCMAALDVERYIVEHGLESDVDTESHEYAAPSA